MADALAVHVVHALRDPPQHGKHALPSVGGVHQTEAPALDGRAQAAAVAELLHMTLRFSFGMHNTAAARCRA